MRRIPIHFFITCIENMVNKPFYFSKRFNILMYHKSYLNLCIVVTSKDGKLTEIDRKIAKLLIERGADVNHVSEGETWFQARGSILTLATAGNSVELAQLLLDAGADPDLQSKFVEFFPLSNADLNLLCNKTIKLILIHCFIGCPASYFFPSFAKNLYISYFSEKSLIIPMLLVIKYVKLLEIQLI